MVSSEFNSAIRSGNLLRARIMLKDSLIVDPTFAQFSEMLAYARRELPGLLVPYDNSDLEDDRSKWNKDLMNTELVEIVNNFSEVRIDHLKKVISVVLAEKIKTAPTVKMNSPTTQQPRASQERAQFSNHPQYGSAAQIEQQKKTARKQALSQITNSSKKIESVMSSVQSKGAWYLSDIRELEDAANQILAAARNYRNNR